MSDEETDTFIDSEMGPENEPEIDPVTDTDTDEEPKIDIFSLKELRENISRNSLEIDDLKNKRDTISSNKSDVSEDMTLTPRKIKYVYSNTFEEHDSDVNEFEVSGLSTSKSKKILPPRLKEAKISFECLLNQIVEIGDGTAGSGFIVIGTIVLFHIDESIISDNKIDIEKLEPIGRLAGDWYTRPTDNFKITRKVKPEK